MFVKNIISGSIIIPEKLRISLFKPQGLRRIIESIPPDNYILGVGYKEGDHQICISGKKKSGELLGDAIKRETQEELSLSFNTEPKIVLKYGKNYLFNSIILGGVKDKGLNSFFETNYKKNNPKGRMMKLDELYPVINFLLDINNTHTNAQEVFVDGGWLSW